MFRVVRNSKVIFERGVLGKLIIPRVHQITFHQNNTIRRVFSSEHEFDDGSMDILDKLAYNHMQALARSLGLPALEKREKILMRLKSHFQDSGSVIPQSLREEIESQVAKTPVKQYQTEVVNEKDEEAVLSAKFATFKQTEKTVEQLLTSSSLRSLAKALGVRTSTNRGVQMHRLNQYYSENGKLDDCLPDFALKETPDHRAPRQRATDPIEVDYDSMKFSSLKKIATVMRLKPSVNREVLLAAVKDRLRRVAAGEVFEDAKRELSAQELEAMHTEKLKALPKITAFKHFLRTKHLKGSVSQDGVYSVERVQEVVTHLKNRGTLPKKDVVQIINDAHTQMFVLPNVLNLRRPQLKDGSIGNFTVCGDTLGNFDNLLHIFSEHIGGLPSDENPYLFLGDLVDKGPNSFELLTTLLLMKLAAPNSIHLIRGAHETTVMNSKFGFEAEVLRLYDQEVLDLYRKLFCALPVAAVIEDKVFAVHGGIGQETSDMTVMQMNMVIDRDAEPSNSGPLSELIWADPQDKENGRDLVGITESRNRGGGFSFGRDVTKKFLRKNNLDLLLRSHECTTEGFDVLHDGRCVTVFSVPMYYGDDSEYLNYGALVRFDQKGGSMTPRYIQYDTAENSGSREEEEYEAAAV